MINQQHIEDLYDCFDESATLLYTTYKLPFLDGIVKTCENIVANSIEEEFSDIAQDLEIIIDKISDINFNKEEIRKAFQYACLKGFKHANISNQMITPESIGVFIVYLIEKLYIKKSIRILDPLVGTGNLITSVSNGMKKDVELYGVDQDYTSYKLTSALFDMLEYGNQVFYQDTLTYKQQYPVELIISDFSGIEEANVYEIIQHHYVNIVECGFLIGVFDEDVVSESVLIEHSKDLNDLWKLFGYIKLPKGITKNIGKCIVIFQKNGVEYIQPNKFLLVDLPEFANQKEMTTVINRMNDWFRNTEFKKLGE